MIVWLSGGLANQLFMYAFGISMSHHYGESVQFYWQRTTWDYALNEFVMRVNLVNQPVYNPRYTEATFAFDKGVYSNPPNTYFKGYWQTEKYFFNPDQLRKEIRFRDQPSGPVAQVADWLRNENSVFIHIRRGDYLNPGTAAYHGNLGHANVNDNDNYYKRAIDYVTERVDSPKFVVFSDDPAWCQQNFPYPVISSHGFTRHEDLYLMSQCKHGIGANSSFSWWGNWMGDYPGRICVAPKKWFNADLDTKDVVPDRWIRL
jgi:hypothetical protein